MHEWIKDRETRLREFFDLGADVKLFPPEALPPDISPTQAEHLKRFNIEWHIIPSADALPFDDDYRKRLYPMCSRSFERGGHHTTSCREALINGHARHQGRIIGVETTLKPRYLPGNRQYYGTLYGFDATADPFAPYFGRGGHVTGTRYAHNYASLREFGAIVNEDWRAHGLMPKGYRLTACPPAVFNLVGNVFHREWSETESLELGFYRDAHGNAICYSVGCNEPGDFSYIHEIETTSDWTLLGFRMALVSEQ